MCDVCGKEHEKLRDDCVVCGKKASDMCDVCTATFCSRECKEKYEIEHKDKCNIDWKKIRQELFDFYGLRANQWLPTIHCDAVIPLPVPWIGETDRKSFNIFKSDEIRSTMPVCFIKAKLFVRFFHIELSEDDRQKIKDLMHNQSKSVKNM